MKNFTQKTKSLRLLALMCVLSLCVGAWGEKITDYTKIVSGKKYYIGATTSKTDYYLSVNGTSTSTGVSGSAINSKSSATIFVFEGSGTSWTIKFDGTSNYLSLASTKANGKVDVVSSASTFTLSNQSEKIRLTINGYSVQKNNSGTQFGSYSGTQTDVWLEEYIESAPTCTVSPTSIDFGKVETGASVAAQNISVTLKNTTSAAATLSGTNADAFEITAGEELSASGTVTVQPKAATLSTVGTYTASLDIEAEGVEGTKSVAISLQVTEPVAKSEYELYKGELVEGDYIICSGNTAMQNVVVNNRIGYTSISAVDGIITTSDQSIVWRLAKDGDYWTIYNEAEGVYAAFTSSDGKAALLSNVTDYARWIPSDSFEFSNKGKTGKYLRYNSGYGFASYAKTTGTTLSLYLKQSTDPSIKLNKSTLTLAIGSSETLTATVKNSEATVVWSTSDDSKVTVDQTGKVTAVTAGEATITATITEGGEDYCDSCVVTVPQPVVVTGVTISPATVPDMYIGTTTTLTASVQGENEPAQNVNWTTSNAEVATVNEGVVTAVAAGDVEITATSIIDDTKSATVVINVKSIANTAETAYTTAEAIEIIDASPSELSTTEVYVKGTISKIDSFNETYKSITYWLDDNAFEVYSGKGLEGADFTAITDLNVEDEVVVKGKIKKYGSTYELDKENILVSRKVSEKKTPTLTATYNTELLAGSEADVFTVEYDGDGNLTVSSTDETVATAEIKGNEVTVTPLTKGSTTITISASSTEEYAAASISYTLKVVQYASIPFAFDGGKSNLTDGMSQSGLGDYSSSPKLKFDSTGDNLIIHYSSEANYLSYYIKDNSFSGGTFDVLESADGESYSTVSSYTSITNGQKVKRLNTESRFVKFVYTNKSSGNVALGTIKIENKIAEDAVMTISAANKWATFYAPFAVDVPANVYSYAVTVDGTNAVRTKIGGDEAYTLPAETAVLVYTDNEGGFSKGFFEGEAEGVAGKAPEGNMLVGTAEALSEIPSATGYTNYILQMNTGTIGWYQTVNGNTLPANRAYLSVPDGTSVKGIFDFTTGINEVRETISSEGMYNMAGQKVGADYKGIVIVNGKKMLNK